MPEAEHLPLRAGPIPPRQLTSEQQPYYQQSKQQTEQQFPPASQPSAVADNGALLGPWSVWIRLPDLGTAFAALQGTISALQSLPPRAPAEQLAASATQCLLAGGALPQPLYDELLQTFGPHGPVHLCSVVGQYLFLSVTLNAFDVPVPG